MPKGRGSNKRRSKYQKDKTESVGRGYLKLMILYDPKERAKRIKEREKHAAGKHGT